MIQWSFLGCLVLEPRACGLHNGNKEILEDIIYAWKVIAYKLGIDPKYSLLEEVNYDLIYAMFKIILEQEYLLHMENLSAPIGIRMSECLMTVFKDVFIGTNINICLRYWYKVLNVNSYKINRENYEHNDIEFFKITTKNQLTGDEKKEMIKNNYNDKYLVTNPSLPFEKFKLNGLKEKILYQLFLFVINVALKYKIGRDIARSVIRNAILKSIKIKKEIFNRCDKITNDRFKFQPYQFQKCPFDIGIDIKVDTEEIPDIY